MTNVDINELRQDFESMSVADIASKTGKSERGVKTFLTRHGIKCIDYDGALRKLSSERRVSTTSEPLNRNKNFANDTSRSNIYSIMEAQKKHSDQILTLVSFCYLVAWIVMSYWGFKEYGGGFFLFWVLISVVAAVANMMTWDYLSNLAEEGRINRMPEVDKFAYLAAKERIAERTRQSVANSMTLRMYGQINEKLVCPHCQSKGFVRNKSTEEITKTKIVPIIGNTIKSRREITQMHCDKCDTTWSI